MKFISKGIFVYNIFPQPKKTQKHLCWCKFCLISVIYFKKVTIFVPNIAAKLIFLKNEAAKQRKNEAKTKHICKKSRKKEAKMKHVCIFLKGDNMNIWYVNKFQ